jgi:predicted AlkP superfamily pyrophosphatase or phosphodiesterase
LRAIFLFVLALSTVSCMTAPSLEDKRTMNFLPRDQALREPGPPRRVVLITVAGLEASDFLKLGGYVAREGDAVRMPELARLAREGSIGVEALPPAPGATYASHAALVTGKRSAKNGIVSNQALDEAGKRSLPFWDNRLLKGTALWDAAIGRGVLALGWPTTTGGRIELIVPDALPTDASDSWLDFIRPLASPVLFSELETISAAAIEASKKGMGGNERDRRSWPMPSEKDAAFAELACRVARSDRDPGLWLIRLDQTADVQALAGYGTAAVSDALGRIDEAIGHIISCFEEVGQLSETAIFVVGDVSFQPVHTRVDPNVVLVDRRLIGRDPRAKTGVRSWLALVRSNGRSAYVYARDAGSAVEAREALEQAAAENGAYDVVSASELAEDGADPQAWFGLAARPGYVIGNGLGKPILRPAETRSSPGAFGFLDPTASSVGFVAWGRGIRPRMRVPNLELIDVAPTIATLLGLRLDEDVDGEALIGILSASVVPPPIGPKRLGVDNDGDADRALRELGGGRDVGTDQ